MSVRLLVTSTDMMMLQFLIPHIIHLQENGYLIDIACSNVGGRQNEVIQKLSNYVCNIYEIRLKRNPYNKSNFHGYKDLKEIINNNHYDLIWTNEPVMGVMTRLAAKNVRLQGVKVLYMVHGFHFYEGAPLINWLLYYPIERYFSKYCDAIVTINREDYQRAKKLKAKFTYYMHGIGMNKDRSVDSSKKCLIRKELSLSEDDFLMLTVAELMPRKNQEIIIKALGVLKDKSIHYILCGKGDDLEKLKYLAKKENIESNVHFIGFRNDVMEIYKEVDLFVFPSKREGLGIAAMEAMHSGLALITSNTSGPKDYMENGKTGFICSPKDVNGFAKSIVKLKNDEKLRREYGNHNKEVVIPYYIENVKKELLKIIEEICSD